jgi:hypothetical protein
LSPAGFFLFLFVSLLTGVPDDISGKALRPGQPDRKKFFAVRVLSEENVSNSKDALGAPDARHAEIRPGGQLVVFMPQKFIDFGTLSIKREADYRIEGLFHMQDTSDARQDYAWIAVYEGYQFPGMWPGGFRFESGIINPFEGSAGVDTLRITNVGTDSLFVDAVIGYGRETEKSTGH